MVFQDGWSSFKEVTLRDMSSDEQHDPDTVYGTSRISLLASSVGFLFKFTMISCLTGASFFVPVAGFICRLCSKFFHFESSAVHTHCKSTTHFEKLKVGLMISDEQLAEMFIIAEFVKELMQRIYFFFCCHPQRYKEILSQKGEAAASSREPLCAADSPGPPAESSRSSSAENPSSDDTGVATNSALSRLKETQQPEDHTDHAEPNAAAQVFSSSSTEKELLSRGDETVSLHSGVQQTPVEFPVSRTEEPEPGAAAKDDDEEEGKEVAAVPGENKNSGKARATPKRRSGRVTNRR